MNFDFWHEWLVLATATAIAAGLAIALAPDSLLFDHHTDAIAKAFFGGDMPESGRDMRAFLFGPLGGTIVGYFVMQLFVVLGPFRRRERWAWHAVAWPLLAWFTLDSAMSVYHGATFNVWMVNLPTLVLVGIPLLATRADFSPRTDAVD
jgi:hypothetical protein